MSGKTTAPHEDLTYRVIGVAKALHRRLGPGQREEIYQRALEAGLAEAGIAFMAQPPLPVYDDGRQLGLYIPDLIVAGRVIVEIKAFATLQPKYLGQVITYLNHTGLPIGLLINFGERSLRPRRVFPSPLGTVVRPNYQWIFVPDWLKAPGPTEEIRRGQ